MKTLMLIAGVIGFSLSTSAAFADLDEADAKALEQTKAMLQDQKKIEAFAATNKDAAQAHQNVKTLLGNNPADTADLYKMSADIFDKMAKDAGGDPAVMQQMLQEALKNPAAFANQLSPEQKAKISELAGKVEARKPTGAPR